MITGLKVKQALIRFFKNKFKRELYSMNKTKFLKVKLKTLTEEARIIRKEEFRAYDTNLRNELVAHRRGPVRSEARATHVAYGFLRGRDYAQVEGRAYSAPNWSKVESMVKRYGDFVENPHLLNDYVEWRKEADLIVKENQERLSQPTV